MKERKKYETVNNLCDLKIYIPGFFFFNSTWDGKGSHIFFNSWGYVGSGWMSPSPYYWPTGGLCRHRHRPLPLPASCAAVEAMGGAQTGHCTFSGQCTLQRSMHSTRVNALYSSCYTKVYICVPVFVWLNVKGQESTLSLLHSWSRQEWRMQHQNLLNYWDVYQRKPVYLKFVSISPYVNQIWW